MPIDQFAGNTEGLSSPAEDAFAITPSDSATLAIFTRAIVVLSAGDLKVTTKAGTTLVFPGVPAGFQINLRVSKVFATGTTATNIFGLV